MSSTVDDDTATAAALPPRARHRGTRPAPRLRVGQGARRRRPERARRAVTALVGPNGSGKTTLLLVLAGLLVPDTGSVTVAGSTPSRTARPPGRAPGWMPDTFGTWDSLTAREVLLTFAAAYRLDAATAARRATELLATVHLTEYADRPASVLSRGQKQRLGLARALVHDPTVLLLDEPASGLDPRSRVDLRILLRRLADEGRTILVSSHVLSRAGRDGRRRGVPVAGPHRRPGRRRVADDGPGTSARSRARP